MKSWSTCATMFDQWTQTPTRTEKCGSANDADSRGKKEKGSHAWLFALRAAGLQRKAGGWQSTCIALTSSSR